MMRENRIKTLLEEKNITQKELAKITGLTESAISHYVKGDRVPRGANLVKIAKALGVTTDELLYNDNPSNKESDLLYAKALIARNASNMTKKEKVELLKLLLGEEEDNATE